MAEPASWARVREILETIRSTAGLRALTYEAQGYTLQLTDSGATLHRWGEPVTDAASLERFADYWLVAFV